PYTLAAADARSATAACRDSGVVLAVGHNRRFAPATESLKAMIEAGEFGTLLHIEAEFAKDTALGLPPGHWRANRAESPAGAMTGLGIHMVDAICFLFGPIARVTAISKQRAVCVPMDDTTCALFEFESGATGYLGTLFASPLTSFLNVYGSKTAAYAGDDFTTLSVRTADAGPAPKPLAAIDTVRAELEEFAATCAGGDAFRVRPEEATHNVAVMEAIVASAAEGSRSVTVA
ncbi:MAG: Gfo/Idh/MocA family oxidoreductase, partial [Alphaproteobacteria bacterium]|nr:Gfo/Idh/MocA family oxidoreductase [Alphaproteobacteria bacterium]